MKISFSHLQKNLHWNYHCKFKASSKSSLKTAAIALQILLILLLLAISSESNAGLVDFSNGLYEFVTKKFGPEAPHRLQIMQTNVRQMKATAGPDLTGKLLRSRNVQLEMPLLKRANDFYNQIPYVSDLEHWGVEDYWATPVELVASFGGDCEDYAIAKYMTLKDLGIPIERLRITYVRAIKIGETHMVLAYYPTPDSDPWILDNLIPEIKHGSERKDLIPVYSFNDDDLWLANGTARKGGASTVRLWRDVIEKMDRESKL
ncbi:transglutaminase-like cysteine peptidase [Undibacterium sp. Dicai25W]|uniref:transglutaminase-like cysteine peptidase n=1 Tax=Undibacterium sp. Dicai25W TaxID=3413034 RepID=UPI003BF035B0